MQSRTRTVTEYMHEVPGTHLDPLTDLREICLQTLRGFKEGMEFGIPSYSFQGKTLVAWSSQRDCLQLQIFDDQIIKRYKPQLKHLEVSSSTIRFKKTDQIDFTLIRQILQEVVNGTKPASND